MSQPLPPLTLRIVLSRSITVPALAVAAALAPASAATALQQRARDTVTVVRDSTPADSARDRDVATRRAVTPELAASAFADAATRQLYVRARRARIAQDSSLMSYDVKARQRLSVRAGISRFTPERLVYRRESAARVQWQRGVGAHVEMTGGRVAIPILGSEKEERQTLQEDLTSTEMSPIPYFPGSETLWIGGAARQAVDERSVVNPLADGAEAYYTFRRGDSVSFTLPNGRVLQLRELTVRPREPAANVFVGSLWFDIATGQLVRAAYRPSVPAKANVSVSEGDSTVGFRDRLGAVLAGAVFSGSSLTVSSIAVEYGLYEGRYWLPRSQIMEGVAELPFGRIPILYEGTFDYASVNGELDLAAITVDTTRRRPTLAQAPKGLPDSLRRAWRDSALAVYREALQARADSAKQGFKVGSMAQCDTASTRVVTQHRFATNLPVSVRVPCSLDSLINSPDLPASVYAEGEEVFGSGDRERLVASALGMAAQAPFSLLSLRPPVVTYGFSMTRYNRVEGFSTGIGVDQELGGGYAVGASGRLGAADRAGNWEASLARSNGSRTMRLAGYRRLVSASDWGRPLSFGSSVSAFLYGKDEGFYYRASGAELLWTTETGARLEWRAFHERQSQASVHTSYSVSGDFIPNIAVTPLRSSGVVVRHLGAFGDDPDGLRALTDFRLEGASGDSTYGRGALDVTVSRGVGRAGAIALTAAAGSSVGGVPVQRRWFLGDIHTVRGQSADTAQSGNAFWLGRLELARTFVGYRTALFGDIGWTGDRANFADVVRPMSGVGLGISAFDGLIRFDVARGLFPREQTRFDLYLGARF